MCHLKDVEYNSKIRKEIFTKVLFVLKLMPVYRDKGAPTKKGGGPV